MFDKDKFPYHVRFPYLRRPEVTEFFVEHTEDMVILKVDWQWHVEGHVITYGFTNKEDATIFKLKFGSI